MRELIVNVTWRDGLKVIEGLKARGVGTTVVATFGAGREDWRDWTSESVRAGADQMCFESAESNEALREAVGFAHELGVEASHAFAEDHTYDEVVSLCRTGVSVGCPSLSFHDSYFRFAIGPEAMKAYVRSILRDVPDAPPLYVHLSNFFGHATMTAAAALTAGASAVDVCANATGHHCGHTSLSEVALVLEGIYGVRTGIALERLRDLAVLLEERTAVPTPLMRPIVGAYAFSADGATWAAESRLPSDKRLHATFPFTPDIVGAEERVIWSDRTLTANTVSAKLSSLGIELSDEALAWVTTRLREQLKATTGYPHWWTDDDFVDVLRTLARTAPGDG